MTRYERDGRVRRREREVVSSILYGTTSVEFFSRGDEEEDVAVVVVVGPARTILKGGRPRGFGRGNSIVGSNLRRRQRTCR